MRKKEGRGGDYLCQEQRRRRRRRIGGASSSSPFLFLSSSHIVAQAAANKEKVHREEATLHLFIALGTKAHSPRMRGEGERNFFSFLSNSSGSGCANGRRMEEAKSFAHAQKYTPRINVLLCTAVVMFAWMEAAASASVSLPFQERNICGWGIRGEGGGGGGGGGGGSCSDEK